MATAEAPWVSPFVAEAAAAIIVAATTGTAWQTLLGRSGQARQPEASHCHAGQPDAEFLQRLSPRYRLGQTFGQFIEFVIHTFPFVLLVVAKW